MKPHNGSRLVQIMALLMVTSCATDKLQKWSIEPEKIRTVIKSQNKEFMKCYDDYLKSGGTNEGKLVLEWDINELGKVQSIAVKTDELKADSVTKCMQDIISQLTFDPGKMEKGQMAHVIFPWKFGQTKRNSGI